MQAVDLRKFKAQVKKHRRTYRLFLTRLEKKRVVHLNETVVEIDKQVWQQTDCLTCANCCKTMTPNYTTQDLKRIAAYLNMSISAFKKKWLKKDRSGDWVNKSLPCQFLDKKTHYCSIYEVRPKACSGFPHHTKKRMKDYLHIYNQNIEYCPATFKLVEQLKQKIERK